jgi:hypothetical protein
MLQKIQDIFKRQPTKNQPKIKHDWQMVSRSYAAPSREIGILTSSLPKESIEKMMLGTTTYLWECLLTGDTKQEEILGSDRPILDEILLKVKQFGPQIVRDESGTPFSITKQQEIIDPSTLPIRRAQ